MKMLLAVVAACAIAPVLGGAVHADGCMMVPTMEHWRTDREHSMINEPEQKAVIYFSKGKEDLIISPSYEGPTSDFAWVVPVPARPKVEIMKGAIFHELAALTTPPPPRPSPNVAKVGRYVDAAACSPVTVLERKTVGTYDVSVLSATDSQALVKWLDTNKYHLPAKAEAPMKNYIKQGWTFVACKVKTGSTAKGLHTGTLAPLRLTFKTKLPVYPMRLSAANPKAFDILLYLIMPDSEVADRISKVSMVSHPVLPDGPAASGLMGTLSRNQTRYPTLAKLTSSRARVFRKMGSIAPKQCKADFIWTLPTHIAAR